jgi:hypothetical protein
MMNFPYGSDPSPSGMDYRHSSRLGPPGSHDGRMYSLAARTNLRTDPMARQTHSRNSAHQSSVQSNNNTGAPRRRIPVAVSHLDIIHASTKLTGIEYYSVGDVVKGRFAAVAILATTLDARIAKVPNSKKSVSS